MSDGQLDSITVFRESIDAVSPVTSIAACFEETITAYKPAFAFVVADKAIEDVV